jgi:hypothetical protein
VTYKVFSRGQFIGESALDYIRYDKRHAHGDFLPTELGEKLMPILTEASRLALEHARSRRTHAAAGTKESEADLATHMADLNAACTHEASLDLELYGPDKRLIPTEWISIRDCELMLAFSDLDPLTDEDIPPAEDDPGLAESVERDLALLEEQFGLDDSFTADPDDGEAWREPRPFPRYQIGVRLLKGESIP